MWRSFPIFTKRHPKFVHNLFKKKIQKIQKEIFIFLLTINPNCGTICTEGQESHSTKNKKREVNKMKNANFEKTLLMKEYGAETYGIKNYDGMTEEEIINACDANNFGGRVYGNICKVYID